MVIEVTFDVTDVYISTTVSPVYVNVSFEAPSGGGGAVWGDITGTLSDQTDLQTALDGKFDDPTGDTTQYIAGDGSLVAFPITGQAGTLVREVRNVTGATLAKGTVVYINGASGNKPTVAKALATSDATSAQTFGLIQADIPNNSNGYLVAFGDLDGLNTSAFAEGVQLYLSATTAGEYTSTKQYAPSHLVYIGVVTRQHVNQGRIEVRIQNGYEMDELHDVAAQTPSNNDGLFYNSTNSLWENKSIATALGYTPANAATTLTINGVTFDLSANRTFTVGSVTGSGASGQVAYWTGTSAQSGSNNLFWDASTNRLGIGTNTPALNKQLDILFNVASVGGAGIGIRNTNSSGYTEIVFDNDTTPNAFGAFLFGYSGTLSSAGANIAYFWNRRNAPILFGTNDTERLRLFGTGNLGIGTGATDGGQRLQVQGTTLLNGNVTFSSATGMTWDATNSRLGIGTNAPISPFHVVGNAYINGRTSIGISPTTVWSSYTSVLQVGGTFFVDFATTPQFAISSNAYYNGTNTIVLKTGGTGIIEFANNGDLNLWNGVSQTAGANFGGTIKMKIIPATGNLLLQNGGTFTDSGERLQVTGNVKVTGGALSVIAPTNTEDGNPLINLGRPNGGKIVSIKDQALIEIGNNNFIHPSTGIDGAISRSENGLFIGFKSATTPSTGIFHLNLGRPNNINNQVTATSEQGGLVQVIGQFNPNTAVSTPFTSLYIRPTINQTGGANGITRGLYVNPTLTSAADFRAIETARGNIVFGNLPTSSAGLPTGAIWNDAGTIKIV